MKEAWKSLRRLLAIRLDAMGDVLMTTPALRAIKETHPKSHLTFLTSPEGAEIARLVPEIDEIWTYQAPWVKASPQRSITKKDSDEIRKWRDAGFDGAVIFTVFSQSPLPAALMCYWAGIPLRLAHCHENPYQLLTHWVPDDEPAQRIRHEVRRQLDLVGAVGLTTSNERLSLRPSLDAYRRVHEHLDKLRLDAHKKWILIHPGATAPSRRYPSEHFARAAESLVRDLGYQVLFTGHRSELDLVESIRDKMGMNSYSLAGVLTLDELAALIGLAPLLIANNSGPAHIAAALGTPVVSLYALTNPQHTPWKIPTRILSHDVPCKYCFKSICPEGHQNCLRLVDPSQIIRAVQELLEKDTVCIR